MADFALTTAYQRNSVGPIRPLVIHLSKSNQAQLKREEMCCKGFGSCVVFAKYVTLCSPY